MAFHAAFLVAILYATLLFSAEAKGTLSLKDTPAYQTQRNCGQSCLNNIQYELDCAAAPFYNDCFCREDLQPIARGYLNGCVRKRGCDNTLDIGGAITAYDDYCRGAGYTASSPGKQIPTTAQTAVPPSITRVPTTRVTVLVTQQVSISTKATPTGTSELVLLLLCTALVSFSGIAYLAFRT